MGPRLRKLAFTVHVLVSVGWIGAVAAYLVLDLTVVMDDDVQRLRAAYVAMDLVTVWIIVPLAFATFLTGLVMSLGTRWGLFRHWWTVLSLFLTLGAVLVLLIETRVIGAHAALAGDPTTTDATVAALGSTLVHSIGGLVVLLVVLVLNIYKPKGLTRYGWRMQQAGRRGRD